MLQRIFLSLERIQPLGFVDQLAGVGEQHGITVEGDAYLAVRNLRGVGWRRLEDGCSALSGVDDFLRILHVGGQEQVDIEGINVVGHRLTAGKGRAGDCQLIAADGLEHANTGIRAVTRHHHHLNQRGDLATLHMPVEIKQRLDQVIAGTRRQGLVLMFLHIAAIVVDHAFRGSLQCLLEHLIRIAHVKQSSRGDAHHQGITQIQRHIKLFPVLSASLQCLPHAARKRISVTSSSSSSTACGLRAVNSSKLVWYSMAGAAFWRYSRKEMMLSPASCVNCSTHS
ncbi:hypothetical protein D3C78_951440 [compost metagenome]